MKLLIAFALLGDFAVSATAQPLVATVEMSNFKFAPAAVDLRAGAPVVLRLRNIGSGGHSFSSPAFFAAAKMEPAGSALVHNGKVEVAGHSSIDLPLTPAAGQYAFKCTHTLHASFGMKGTITVR